MEKGAMPHLEALSIRNSELMEEVPSGIEHLTNLHTFELGDMSKKLISKLDREVPDGDYWKIAHIPQVRICRSHPVVTVAVTDRPPLSSQSQSQSQSQSLIVLLRRPLPPSFIASVHDTNKQISNLFVYALGWCGSVQESQLSPKVDKAVAFGTPKNN
ncbi:hypothetical protein CsSME_00049637 [Camellia sinensis var. sinensis]